MSIGAIKALAVAALLLGLFYFGFKTGSERVQAKWDKAVLVAEREADKERMKKQEIVTGYAEKRVAKSAKDREVVASNAGKVDQYAPTDFPPLPGSFRLWHDAAAEGQALDDRPGVDAPSVSLKIASAVIAKNYAACLYDQQRLEELQAIVRVMNGGSDGKEKDSN